MTIIRLYIDFSQSSLTEKIVSSVREDLKIDEPGRGVIFVQEVNKACGLY